ncbi:lysis protein, partial [Escherichia coli]|nr:lysis protein [Escherichia coli]
RRLHIKAVCQSVREATTASGVDNAASPDWQTPLNGIISPSERLITMQKQLEGTQKYINEQCR